MRELSAGGKTGTNFIDVTENDLLNGVVLENLANDTTVTTTNDKYLLGVRVARKW